MSKGNSSAQSQPIAGSVPLPAREAEPSAAAVALARRALEYIGWFDGTFGPAAILDADAEIRDLALAVYRSFGEPEPTRVMRTKGKRP